MGGLGHERHHCREGPGSASVPSGSPDPVAGTGARRRGPAVVAIWRSSVYCKDLRSGGSCHHRSGRGRPHSCAWETRKARNVRGGVAASLPTGTFTSSPAHFQATNHLTALPPPPRLTPYASRSICCALSMSERIWPSRSSRLAKARVERRRARKSSSTERP